jgi:hypothetical protein
VSFVGAVTLVVFNGTVWFVVVFTVAFEGAVTFVVFDATVLFVEFCGDVTLDVVF